MDVHRGSLLRRQRWKIEHLCSLHRAKPLTIPSLAQAVIKEVTDSNGKIVLFIDEIHLVVGAGATSVSAPAPAGSPQHACSVVAGP